MNHPLPNLLHPRAGLYSTAWPLRPFSDTVSLLPLEQPPLDLSGWYLCSFVRLSSTGLTYNSFVGRSGGRREAPAGSTVRGPAPLSTPSACLQDNPSFCSRLEFLPEGSLRIHPVLAQDAGHYLCLASNSAGSDRKGLDLRVFGRWAGKSIILPSSLSSDQALPPVAVFLPCRTLTLGRTDGQKSW